MYVSTEEETQPRALAAAHGDITIPFDAGHAPMGEAACTGWTRLRPSCEQGAVIAGACRPEGHGCGVAYPLL